MSNTVLITGANRGIGLALTQYYQARGDQVIALCRTASSELQQTHATIIDGVDIRELESLRRAKAELSTDNIDILINNAGILAQESFPDLNFESIENQMQVNAYGPLKVCDTFGSFLKGGSKIALITSRMGSIADNGSGSRYGYRMSKAALNAAGKSLAIDLAPKNISVAILHPGYVQTDMVNHNGDISAATAASRLAERIDELNLHNSGNFWHSNGQILPW
jgi:NAD(P)-dependent dehydrogenase (short-subunit alcohol dehydrogenase family)